MSMVPEPTIAAEPRTPPAPLPPVFVINMEKDAHRRRAMKDRLDAIGLPFAFFDAVDGRALSLDACPVYDGARRRRYFGRDMTRGELGCLMSHRAVYRKMLDEGLEAALVLEDDVLFEDDFPAVLRALMTTPVPWDLIRFLGSAKIYRRGCRIVAPLLGGYALARLPSTHGGAHAYLIRRAAARRLYLHTERSWVPIDTLQGYCWRTGIESLVVHPAPLRTDDAAGSTIGDVRFDKTVRTAGLARALYPLSRFWFKLWENSGKRYVYWSAWFRDRRSRRAAASSRVPS